MRSDLRRSESRRPELRRSDLRRLSAVSLVTALTLGVAAAPALADEPAPTPTPVGVGRAVTQADQRGSFRVTAWTDAPQATVTAVSAKVRQGDTVLADIPALLQSTPGTFTLPADATLKLTEDQGTIPALGKYAIDVTATDSLGNTVTRTGAGTLDFTLRPLLSFAVGTPGWNDPSIRPQGKLTGVQPGSGDIVPLPGRSVSYQRSTPDEGPAQSALTTDTGEFAGAPIPATRAYESYRASFAEDSAEVHGTATDWRYFSEWQARKMTVTATADKARAVSGETVTITGRVTDPENGGAPLADQPVRVRLGAPHDYYHEAVSFPQTVRTDADGNYTAKLVAAAGPNASGWTVESADLFQAFSPVQGTLVMPLDSRTTTTGYSLAPDARLKVYGQLRSPYERWSGGSSSQTVLLEQSPDGQTGWKKVGSTSFYSDVRSSFGIAVWSKGGWFRLRHLTSDQYAESVGKPFYIVRTETRILNVNAAPEPVRKGSTVTVTGTLQHNAGGWKPLAYKQVQLVFRAKGTSKWITVAKGNTASNGNVALKHKATGDGVYNLVYVADGTHFQASGVADYVDVR
ncbi:hypothetical protein ACIGEZ_30695 [Streptomyces sp. NPDC085481]|uniref:hypothetical protein n=1 Tax=Streptomyces sp. NPDC085481 TaxID=3365727 RepID=UPI0037D07F07